MHPAQGYCATILHDAPEGRGWATFPSLVNGASVGAPAFIHNLLELDVSKSGANHERRSAFRAVIETNMNDCEDENRPGLQVRLEQTYRLYILNPRQP